MALHETTTAHSVRLFQQTLATHRRGGDGSRTAGGSCRRPNHRCLWGHHRGGRTRPTHPPRARWCAIARDQQHRLAVGRRANETTSPTHPQARACGCPRRGHRGARPPPRHFYEPRRPTPRPAGGRTARRAGYGVVRGGASPPHEYGAAVLTAARPLRRPPTPPPRPCLKGDELRRCEEREKAPSRAAPSPPPLPRLPPPSRPQSPRLRRVVAVTAVAAVAGRDPWPHRRRCRR